MWSGIPWMQINQLFYGEINMKHLTLLKYRSRSLIAKYQKGVTMIEYALMASLVAIIAMTTLGTLGNTLKNLWSNIAVSV